MACHGGDSRLLRSPSGDHAGERGAGGGHHDTIVLQLIMWDRGNCMLTLPPRGPLYSGEGCTLTPSPSQPRATAREDMEGGGG
jgi:hypothetical protein